MGKLHRILVRIQHRIRQKLRRKYDCIVCGTANVDFVGITNALGSKLKAAGFPYKLASFETLNTKNYACANCGASDRERLIALYLQDSFKTQHSALNMLDIAPNTALSNFIRKMLKAGNYRTADLYMTNVDDHVDVTNMHIYPDNHFDILICSHVLEHVRDDRSALREIHRVLKPGGRSILLVPISNSATTTDEGDAASEDERLRRFGQEDHIRLYAKNDFIKRITSTGFALHELGEKHFSPRTFRNNGITKTSILYIAEK